MGMEGQPASPGPFNLWILRVAADAVVRLSAPPEVTRRPGSWRTFHALPVPGAGKVGGLLLADATGLCAWMGLGATGQTLQIVW